MDQPIPLKIIFFFCQLWGIRHITGIPHSPTGQAIVERAHQTLKVLLQKQKGGEVLAAAEPLAKAVYVLKYLRLTGDREEPPVVIHSMDLKSDISRCGDGAFAQYKDVTIGEWKGPLELKMTGRGYACVITDTGTRWVPSRWVQPWKKEVKKDETETE